MIIEGIRNELKQHGTDSLKIDLLTLADLEGLDWSGDASHLENVRMQILAPNNTIQLAVRTAEGVVISKGLIDFSVNANAGTISQLATHPRLQSLGVGTLLILEMERLMSEQSLSHAVLGVELINKNALRLYERLGYLPTFVEQHSWTATNRQGEPYLYKTEVQMMSKSLG